MSGIKWQQWQDEYLLNNPYASIQDLAQSVNRTKKSIIHRRIILKLPNLRNCQRQTELSDNQSEILEGLLLGDGSLSCRLNARLGLKSVVESFVDDIVTSIPIKWHKKRIIPAKKTTIKGEQYSTKQAYECVSLTDKTLTYFYNKWYVDKIKIVPTNLVLTPTVLKYWFYGDGCTVWEGNRPSPRLMLYTNNFTYTECIFLQKLFNNININFNINKTTYAKNNVTYNNKNRGYILRISKINEVYNFFNYIGCCHIPEFSYKWKIPRKQ